MPTASPVIVLVPAYNEEKTIWKTIHLIQATLLPVHILVVNDGSRDRTAEVAKRNGVEVLSLRNNVGKARAVFAGMEIAIKRKPRAIVTLDADMLALPREGLEQLIQHARLNTQKGAASMMVASVREGMAEDYRSSGIRSFSYEGVRHVLASPQRKTVEGYALEKFLDGRFKGRAAILHESGIVAHDAFRKGKEIQFRQALAQSMRELGQERIAKGLLRGTRRKRKPGPKKSKGRPSR
jgi:glycosyltransferase involved in cell wall biosynthesis